MTQPPIDWQMLRQKLAHLPESLTWRSLSELAERPEFEEWLHREFPRGASVWHNGISRRRFLQLMAASLGLAGLTACIGRDPDTIVPYVEQPEQIVPGKPLYFASGYSRCGYGTGILVESHDGRPTKIEGNPDHPDSQGATDVFGQAAILSLYDPDRSQTVTSGGQIRTWSEFDEMLTGALAELRGSGGEGFRILTPMVTSPTMAAQLSAVLERFPQAQWNQYEPVNGDGVYEGTRLAFGEALEPRYDFSQAEVILSLEADFLFAMPGHLAYTRQYSEGRKVRAEGAAMNRLYVVESTPSLTGAMADHRLVLPPVGIEILARHLAAELGQELTTGPALNDADRQWLAAVTADLREHAGRCLVLAGESQPPAVHALAHAINGLLDNVGRTVDYTPPVTAGSVNQGERLRQLAADMRAGAVTFLMILESNPVYEAPADVAFEEALTQVPLSVHLGLYENETSLRCTWHVPQVHFLEGWSDVRAYDGTATIVQPLIEPLYNGRSVHELLAVVLGEGGRSSLEIVFAFWQAQLGKGGSDGGPETEGEDEPVVQAGDDMAAVWWQRILQVGVVPDSGFEPVDVSLQTLDLSEPPAPDEEALYLLFRPSYTVWDGRYSNNAWLQETPHPFSKVTWGNAALISPRTAEQLGLESEMVVRLVVDERVVAAPLWVLPGQADGCVTVHLGYGRTRDGRVGQGVGFSAYRLRTLDNPWFSGGLTLQPAGGRVELAVTQEHHAMEGREMVQTAALSRFRENPGFVHEGQETAEQPSIYPEKVYDGYAWGMSIDLNLCIGCNACTVACQAENNIPVVGQEGVLNAREMHWIRVDGYFKGDLDNPEYLHQPVPCMHCEKAPCELVCPVAATTHSDEGLNEMTYNRCVGTRYCSNNCPYKVRRFNFFDYAGEEPDLLAMARNPDVTVRARGVMEKCTYCVQRINQARIEAKVTDRPIQDGEIKTACQQVCPAQAIMFGDLNDETSQVSRWKGQPHDYALLEALNTQPRTTYLARFRNLNPDMEEAE